MNRFHFKLSARYGEATLNSWYMSETDKPLTDPEAFQWAAGELERWQDKYGECETFTLRATEHF